MDTIPIPIYYKDENGVYKGCNVSFEEWFGIKREDILGKDSSVLKGTSQEYLIDDVDKDLFEHSGVRVYEASIENVDGILHSVVLHKAAYKNTKGEIAGLVGAIFDITARKKAENDLRRAEEKYRSIFENSALGIFRTTPEGRYLDANPSFVRMLGFRGVPELINALAFSGSDLADVTERDGAYVFEREYWRKDGRRIITSQNVRAIRNEKGEVLNYEGFVEDVTKRKLAEQRLKESQQMLKAVLDNIPMHVYWMDRSMRIMGGNKSFCSFFGIARSEDVIGKTALEAMTDLETARRTMRVDGEIIATDRPVYHMQWAIPNKEGDPVWLVVNKVPLHDEQGNVFGVLSTAEDVTQNVRLEKQLVQSQKMEAIGTLAGGIAHDFNNILTSIMNSTELAMEDVDADSFAERDLERVLKASERGSRLVKQILTFSRPTQEGFQPTNVAEVVSEAVALIKASLPRNIEIRDSIAPGLTACLADPTQIHQIVMNLCTNSFHALREAGGRLEVQLSSVFVERLQGDALDIDPGEYLKLTIADDGPGIAQEIMDKIFDPFFTTKGKGEGTGLGLAVVHGIIKGHKGACRVDSVPLERTSFDIFLPVMKESCPDLFSEVQDALPGSERVMFVEDDPDQLELIPRVLGQLGYRVDGFKGAVEALDFVTRTGKEYDVVVTDYDMPELNGLDFARSMDRMQPEVPVILVSGRKQAMEVARGVEIIRKVIIKPYNKGIISRALRQVLDAASEDAGSETGQKSGVAEHG
jgi:PAS domain S-box-containing protein